ncbi:MAG: STAS domain-containing protein [Armatimonadota bacterium]|nr:STAS domain-containing protein [Armatimonadota bacterium]
MRITAERTDEDTALCHVTGELDAYTAPDLRDALDEQLDQGVRWIVADLTELTYLDSTGLGILIETAKKCRQAGGDVAVACDRKNLLRIFQISGTHEILNVVKDVGAARERLQELAQERSEGAGGEEAP